VFRMQPHAQGPAHAVHQASVESVGQSRVKMFEQQQVGWPRWQLAATRGWPSSPAIAIASVAWAFAFALVASRSPWAFHGEAATLARPDARGLPDGGWDAVASSAAKGCKGCRGRPKRPESRPRPRSPHVSRAGPTLGVLLACGQQGSRARARPFASAPPPPLTDNPSRCASSPLLSTDRGPHSWCCSISLHCFHLPVPQT
jgi:hypothetical protein